MSGRVSSSSVSSLNPKSITAQQQKLAGALDDLSDLAKPHGKGKTLAAFLKENRGKSEAKKAFTAVAHHLNATKALHKPHILGKLAPILADFLGEINPPEARFDLLNQLLTDSALQELGQLALGQLLENPDQLKQLKLLKKANPSFSFDKTVGDRKSAFGEIMSKVQVPYNLPGGVPALNPDGSPATRSLGHDLLIKLNEFAKSATDPESKLFAEQLVSMLFDESGLSRCLEKVDLASPQIFRDFLPLGKGKGSPAAIVLKLQAEQMSTPDEIEIVVDILKAAGGMGCALDQPGGPIEAFMTKALSAKGQIDYGSIVTVALLCTESREVPIFDHLLKAMCGDNGALLGAHSAGMRVAIETLLKGITVPSQDIRDRLESLDYELTSPATMALGTGDVHLDPKTDRLLTETSSVFSRGRSTVPDMQKYWEEGTGAISLSRNIEKLCKKGHTTGHSKGVGGVVSGLVNRHINDRLRVIQDLDDPNKYSVADLEDMRAVLVGEKRTLSAASLRRESVFGSDIDSFMNPDKLRDVDLQLEYLCKDSKFLIDIQLKMIDAKLKSFRAGPQSTDFSDVLTREVVPGKPMTWGDRLSGEIKALQAAVFLLDPKTQSRGSNSNVPKQLSILKVYLAGLIALRDELAGGKSSDDPSVSISTLRATLTRLDPEKGILFKSTLVKHSHMDHFLDELETAVLDHIDTNREGVVGSDPDSVPKGVLVRKILVERKLRGPNIELPLSTLIDDQIANLDPNGTTTEQDILRGLTDLNLTLTNELVDPMRAVAKLRTTVGLLPSSNPVRKQMRVLLNQIEKAVKQQVAENKKNVRGTDARGALHVKIVTENPKWGKKVWETIDEVIDGSVVGDLSVLKSQLSTGTGDPLAVVDGLLLSAVDAKSIMILKQIKAVVMKQIIANGVLDPEITAVGAHDHDVLIERQWLKPNITEKVSKVISKEIDRLKAELRNRYAPDLEKMKIALEQLQLELQGAGRPLDTIETLLGLYKADPVFTGKLNKIKSAVIKQMAENKKDMAPNTVSTAMTDHNDARLENSQKTIAALTLYQPPSVSRDAADRAIAGVAEMPALASIAAGLGAAIKTEFFDLHNRFTIMRGNLSDADAKIAAFVAIQSGDPEVKAALTVALKKLVLQFSATGQVDLQQDATLEQLDERTHYKNAVLSARIAPQFWQSIEELDRQVSSSVGSSVAIQMFHNSLVMKGFTGLQTVEEWVDKGLSKAIGLPGLRAELKAFMDKLRPRLDKLVVSLETVNDVRVLRNLLAKLFPGDPDVAKDIDDLTTLIAAHEQDKDYSETRPGTTRVGLVQSARLNTEEKVVRLNDIRMRYESLGHLHKQMQGLVALNGNAKVGKFGPQELADIERELDSLGKALGLRASGKAGIKELNPLDIPDYADGRTGWDTLDGLMTKLDGLVGVSDGVTKPGLRLMAGLASREAGAVTGNLGVVFTTAQTSFNASSANFDRSWGSPFTFSQVPLTDKAQRFEALFELKSEIAELQLQLTDPPGTNQAGMVQSYKQKVADFNKCVLELSQLPHQESNVSFGMLRAAYNDPKRLAAFKECPHLMGAMHESMARVSIATLQRFCAENLTIPATVKALVKEGVLKSETDPTLTVAFKTVLQSSIENAPLSVSKDLLSFFKRVVSNFSDSNPVKREMQAVLDACKAKLRSRVSDEVVKVERHLILHGALRARGALLGESCQSDVINRLVALESRNEVFQSETDAVVFATVDKMATQIMDAWVRAGQSTMFQDPIPFELSLQGHGTAQKDMAERLASGLYEMFTAKGVPLAGMNVVLTGDKLTISFKPGVPLATRESLVVQMQEHKALLAGVTRETFAASEGTSTVYQGKVQTFAAQFAAANTPAALEVLLKQIVDNNDPQQKQGLMDYLKSGPLPAARAVELRTAITTLATTPATSAIMDGNHFSPDQWQVIFQALTPANGAGKKDYFAGASNIRAVLGSIVSRDEQAAFLKQFLPTKEVDAAFASVPPALDLMACKLLAATMEVPKTVDALRTLLMDMTLTSSLFDAISSRVLADKEALNTLFMGDKGIPNGLDDTEWIDILKTLEKPEFKTIFNDKWTQAKRVQLATVLDRDTGGVLRYIQMKNRAYTAGGGVRRSAPLAPVSLAPVAGLTADQVAKKAKLMADYKSILDAYRLTEIIPDGGFSSTNELPADVAEFLGLVPGPDAVSGNKVYLPTHGPQPLSLSDTKVPYSQRENPGDNDDYTTRLMIANTLLSKGGGTDPEYALACSLLGFKYDSGTQRVQRTFSGYCSVEQWGWTHSDTILNTGMFRGEMVRWDDRISTDGCKTNLEVGIANGDLVREGVLQSIAEKSGLSFDRDVAVKYLGGNPSVLEDHPNGMDCALDFTQEKLDACGEAERPLIGCYWAALCEKLGIPLPVFLEPYKAQYDQANADFLAPPPPPKTKRPPQPLPEPIGVDNAIYVDMSTYADRVAVEAVYSKGKPSGVATSEEVYARSSTILPFQAVADICSLVEEVIFRNLAVPVVTVAQFSLFLERRTWHNVKGQMGVKEYRKLQASDDVPDIYEANLSNFPEEAQEILPDLLALYHLETDRAIEEYFIAQKAAEGKKKGVQNAQRQPLVAMKDGVRISLAEAVYARGDGRVVVADGVTYATGDGQDVDEEDVFYEVVGGRTGKKVVSGDNVVHGALGVGLVPFDVSNYVENGLLRSTFSMANFLEGYDDEDGWRRDCQKIAAAIDLTQYKDSRDSDPGWGEVKEVFDGAKIKVDYTFDNGATCRLGKRLMIDGVLTYFLTNTSPEGLPDPTRIGERGGQGIARLAVCFVDQWSPEFVVVKKVELGEDKATTQEDLEHEVAFLKSLKDTGVTPICYGLKLENQGKMHGADGKKINTTGQKALILMEYIPGSTLFDVLANVDVPLSPAVKKESILKLWAAMAAMHEANVVWGDLKPENVIVKPDGTIRLIDLGMAGIADKDERVGIAGTPLYAAPEVIAHADTKPKYKKASDVFSMGVMIRAILTGSDRMDAPDVDVDVKTDKLMQFIESGINDDDTGGPHTVEDREAMMQSMHALHVGAINEFVKAGAPGFGGISDDKIQPLRDFLLSMIAFNPAARPVMDADTEQKLSAILDAIWPPA